eukprot:1191254-Prorocentrum_minimum.AAC.2
MSGPVRLPRIHEGAKHGLHQLVRVFSLPVPLGVVASGHSGLRPGQTQELCPESRGKSDVPVADHLRRHSITSPPAVLKDVGHVFG